MLASGDRRAPALTALVVLIAGAERGQRGGGWSLGGGIGLERGGEVWVGMDGLSLGGQQGQGGDGAA